VPWDELIGQDEAAEALRNALRTGRLPHAYLFLGPEGAGKRTAARLFGRALLCDLQDGEICGKCGPCVRTGKGGHPDFHEFAMEESERFIKREPFEEFVARIYLKSFEGRRKVFLIPHAERLNDTTANLFLKTLEEPPPDTVILLTAGGEQQLLETIVSRAQRVRFRPLPRKVIARELEKRGMAAPEAMAAAAEASGSLCRALALREGDGRDARDFVLKDLLSPKATDTARLAAALVARARDAATKSEASGTDALHAALRRYLDLSALALRDAVVLARGGGQAAVLMADQAEDIARLSKISETDLMSALAAVERAGRAVSANARVETAAVVLAGDLVEALADRK
jgi:DNA polymerase III subunit delta'